MMKLAPMNVWTLLAEERCEGPLSSEQASSMDVEGGQAAGRQMQPNAPVLDQGALKGRVEGRVKRTHKIYGLDSAAGREVKCPWEREKEG